jgi:hypothetical protein
MVVFFPDAGREVGTLYGADPLNALFLETDLRGSVELQLKAA